MQMPSQTDLNALSVKVNKYKAELRQLSDLTVSSVLIPSGGFILLERMSCNY